MDFISRQRFGTSLLQVCVQDNVQNNLICEDITYKVHKSFSPYFVQLAPLSGDVLINCNEFIPAMITADYSGRAPLAHPLFSAPLPLAHLLGAPFYLFYLTKPVLLSALPP